jgi:hypothetical protein
MSECEEPCLANWSAISLPSIPICSGTYTSWIPFCSASFTRDWWQSQTSFNRINYCDMLELWLKCVTWTWTRCS